VNLPGRAVVKEKLGAFVTFLSTLISWSLQRAKMALAARHQAAALTKLV
jgi:hypothetical protein